MSNSKKYPIISVLWEDISSSDTSWKQLDEALEWADSDSNIVHQVGFQLDNTEDYLLIVDSIFEECDLMGTVTKIPKSVVKQIQIIKP